MTLDARIESLLFAHGKPLALTGIARMCGVSVQDTREALERIRAWYVPHERGIVLIEHEDAFAIMTAPEAGEFVREALGEEMMRDLTKPALETLAVIAYRGPVTKAEIEYIRGVNVTLVLRNLMMRGLVEETHSEDRGVRVYALTHEFVGYLGLRSLHELPHFEELSDPQLVAPPPEAAPDPSPV